MEGEWVEQYDVDIATFVVGVTMLAVETVSGYAPVEAGFAGDIVEYVFVFMALYTQATLFVFCRCVMALIALCFQFTVGSGEWSRHQ